MPILDVFYGPTLLMQRPNISKKEKLKPKIQIPILLAFLFTTFLNL
jgi:hypothetical protein